VTPDILQTTSKITKTSNVLCIELRQADRNKKQSGEV